jgi:hypothetical protein
VVLERMGWMLELASIQTRDRSGSMANRNRGRPISRAGSP